VYGAVREQFTFAKWHRAVEKHVEASGLAWTFLRPSGFMQNYFNYSGETIRTQGAIYASADGPGAHIDARDIGAAAAVALTRDAHAGKAYELTGPRAFDNAEAARILSRAAGREIRFVPLPPEEFKKGALAMGMPPAYVDALVDLDRAYAAGILAGTTTGVRDLTGRDPITFEEFAKDYADRFR
jgi:uncharacterized protein YbjT (DUF2867 family)